MKTSKSTLILTFILLAAAAYGQEKELQLKSFRKIVTSPKINLILKKGDHESIRITASNVSMNKVNVMVVNNKLHIFLDDARYLDKRERVWEDGYSRRKSVYEDVSVTAYVTYSDLKGIEVRGEEEVLCEGEIHGDKFKLKAYGTTKLRFAMLNVRKFKASLYGENNLRVMAGETSHQKYNLYGENKIETRGVESRTIATNIYGEGRINLNASDEVRLNSFGEPDIIVEGSPQISKGIVIGRTNIRVY